MSDETPSPDERFQMMTDGIDGLFEMASYAIVRAAELKASGIASGLSETEAGQIAAAWATSALQKALS